MNSVVTKIEIRNQPPVTANTEAEVKYALLNRICFHNFIGFLTTVKLHVLIVEVNLCLEILISTILFSKIVNHHG